MDDLKLAIANSINSNTHKLILSAPVSGCDYKRMTIVKNIEGYSVEKLTQTQAFHSTIDFDGLVALVTKYLGTSFRQLTSYDGEREHTIKISKKGRILTNKRTLQSVPAILEHDRKKNYILEEGTPIMPLIDMGIFTEEGRVVKSMYGKFKQINRFVEIIDDEVSKLAPEKQLTVIDFGCGKSYLTFILYHYLTEIKGMNVKIVGLDLKKQVIDNCNATAEKYGYKNLTFKLGDISDYNGSAAVDMVITLHACDTATDYALYNAICRGAKLIFSVPCCQHEINSQIESDDFSLITKYGIVKERISALLTDAIRANMLEYSGYRTQLVEFIDMEHTPKNIFIRAKKTTISREIRQKALKQVEQINREFSLNPTLYRLIMDDQK